ncbi:MAG: hypothetical protein RL456_1737 [Pseudomonadota bacterium]|jgi:small ligand-binding sensory domain FIST
MTGFLVAHATHPDARMALALAAAQLDARRAAAPAFRPTLGLVYLTDAYASRAEDLLAEMRARWPGVAWAGGVGIGVAASGVEYFDEPALAIMLADLPPDSFGLYSGERPLGRAGWSVALVHGDGATPDLADVLAELAGRTATGYLFGGLMASRGRRVQFCASADGAGGVYEGGVSGVAFTGAVRLLSRVTQGCMPVGPARRVDAAGDHVVIRLDGEPALDCLLGDLGIDLADPRTAVPVLRATLVGLTDAGDDVLARGGQFGADTRVRHLIGLDPMRSAVAIADTVEPGMQLTFCRRDPEAARRDLMRICAELRDELSPPDGDPSAAEADEIVGAVYVSCSGRGGPHFGGPSAELQIVRHALGDVPLVGFFAAGEVARHHLYGYTGVLTVFVRDRAGPPSGA